MKTNAVFLLETFLFEGVALAFGVWQLWSVWPRKSDKADAKPPLTQDPGHSEGEHGLDQR